VDHHEPFPDGIPEPESLPSTADLLGEFEHPIAQQWAYERPFDIRHVQSPLYIRAEGEREPTNAVWMKSKGPLPDDLNLHRAALAYASDYTLLEPILRRHGIAWISPGIKFASLDHAMWWHRPFRADEWLLYVQNSPSASGARGLGVGRVFSRSGELVATVAQEGMMRIPVEAVDA
jgi:acyl-CoA thioesterase-2